MLQKITMPSAGQTTDELIVARLYKKEGDKVERGDIMMEIETDKAVLSVESFAKGTVLKLLVKEGEMVKAGEAIAYIGAEGDLKDLTGAFEQSVEIVDIKDDYVTATTAKEKELEGAAISQLLSDRKVKATPAAKKAARDNELDINEIFKEAGKEVLRRHDIEEFKGAVIKTGSRQETKYNIIPLTNMRRAIAARMTESALSMPVFILEVEADMGECIELRAKLNKKADDIQIAYHDILAKCVANLAAKYPLINAFYKEDCICVYKEVNIGIAVSLDNGVIVPIVHGANEKSLSNIAKINSDNIIKARNGLLKAEDLDGCTLTISNLGMYPITRFTAIINLHQSCIISIGSIINYPVWINNQWEARPIMSVTASFDHRVMDGAYGAAFLKDLKELLENPILLFL